MTGMVDKDGIGYGGRDSSRRDVAEKRDDGDKKEMWNDEVGGG